MARSGVLFCFPGLLQDLRGKMDGETRKSWALGGLGIDFSLIMTPCFLMVKLVPTSTYSQ